MARDFPDPLSLAVPLRTTWEEQWILTDDDDAPVDLTGYEFRMQVRAKEDGVAGHDAGDLLLTIDTTDASPMATITPLEGRINFSVPAALIASLSPDWEKLKAVWDAELYIPGAGGDAALDYVIPVVKGSTTFKTRVTKVEP